MSSTVLENLSRVGDVSSVVAERFKRSIASVGPQSVDGESIESGLRRPELSSGSNSSAIQSRFAVRHRPSSPRLRRSSTPPRSDTRAKRREPKKYNETHKRRYPPGEFVQQVLTLPGGGHDWRVDAGQEGPDCATARRGRTATANWKSISTYSPFVNLSVRLRGEGTTYEDYWNEERRREGVSSAICPSLNVWRGYFHAKRIWLSS